MQTSGSVDVARLAEATTDPESTAPWTWFPTAPSERTGRPRPVAGRAGVSFLLRVPEVERRRRTRPVAEALGVPRGGPRHRAESRPSPQASASQDRRVTVRGHFEMALKRHRRHDNAQDPRGWGRVGRATPRSRTRSPEDGGARGAGGRGLCRELRLHPAGFPNGEISNRRVLEPLAIPPPTPPVYKRELRPKTHF